MSRKGLAKPVGYATLLVLLFLIPLFVTSPYALHILIMVGINIILASSLRLITTTGLLSFGHGGMMAVGAYTSALLVMKAGFSFWAALPLAGLAALTLALLVGYPFVRLKGIYFVMVTLFLAEIIRLVTEQWRSFTGGVSGIMGIPSPNPLFIPGILRIDFASKVDFYYFILALVLVILAILYAIEFSSVGRTFQAMKQDSSLAESIGINTVKLKLFAFSAGCFFAGIAGAFFSHYLTAITPSRFGFLLAIYIFIYMIVGGAGRFFGPLLGAILLTFIPELGRGLREFQPLLFAGLLILIIFFLPEGLVSLPQRLKKLVHRRFTHA